MRTATPTFIRLLNLLTAIRETVPFNELSADEQQLLEDLILHWHHSSVITVSEVMRGSGRSSSSAIYRRLIALKHKGIIALRVDDNDRRVKFVEPTATVTDYVKQLSKGLALLVKGQRTT